MFRELIICVTVKKEKSKFTSENFVALNMTLRTMFINGKDFFFILNYRQSRPLKEYIYNAFVAQIHYISFNTKMFTLFLTGIFLWKT